MHCCCLEYCASEPFCYKRSTSPHDGFCSPTSLVPRLFTVQKMGTGGAWVNQEHVPPPPKKKKKKSFPRLLYKVLTTLCVVSTVLPIKKSFLYTPMLNPGHAYGVDFLLLRSQLSLLHVYGQLMQCVGKHNNILYTKILISKMSLTHKQNNGGRSLKQYKTIA